MGILDSATKDVTKGRKFVSSLLSFDLSVPKTTPAHDFKSGLVITEYVNGKPRNDTAIRLTGNMMPKDKLNHGGKLRMNKEFYPGNSEASVQILGTEEKDLTIQGRFYDKRYRDARFRGVAEELTQAFEEMRRRGNLVRIKLGDSFEKWGFIEDTDFDLKTRADIDYKINFSIVHFRKPKRCFQLTAQKNFPSEVNQSLINEAAAYNETFSDLPLDIPRSIGDQINDLVSNVAGVMAAVTGFVNDVLGTVEDVSNAVNRGLGLIAFAKSELSRTRRRIGQIGLQAQLVGLPVPSRYTSAEFIVGASDSTFAMAGILDQLRSRLEQLSATVPLARYRVVAGDTLQKLAVKFYGESGEWEKIYEHNNLSSIELELGSVLEIPKP